MVDEDNRNTSKLVKSYGSNLNTISGKSFCKTFGTKKNFTVSSGESLTNFYIDYCKLADEDKMKEKYVKNTHNLGLDIGEVVENSSPIIVEMLFTMKTDLNEENTTYQQISFYNEDFFVKIVQIIQQTILNKFSVSEHMYELICCVLENNLFFKNGCLCQTLKFHFPYCNVDVEYQKKKFLPELIKSLIREKSITMVDNITEDSWKKIIQPLKTIIPLYRSKSDLKETPMNLIKIYGDLLDNDSSSSSEETDDDDYSVTSKDNEQELENVFQISSHSLIKNGYLINNFNENIQFYIPLFLSLHYCSIITLPKEYSEEEEEHFDDYESDKEPTYLAQIFLRMLSKHRFEQENSWLMIGNILFNTYTNNNKYTYTQDDWDEDKGLELWKKYSKNTKNLARNPKVCENKYYSFRKTRYTVKTLAFWARIDNIKEYTEWHYKWCKDALKDALVLTDNKVMEAVYRVFWLDYISRGETYKEGWYVFTETGYELSKNCIDLRNDINDKLIKRYELIKDGDKHENSSRNRKRGGDYDSIVNEATGKKIDALIKKLGKDSNVKAIINMCDLRFYNKFFDRQKDMDYNLLGCLNGVIECSDTKAYFREMLPEDLVTMNTSIRYPVEYSWNTPIVKELMDFLNKVFPDKELLHYFLKDEASHLIGKNYEKRMRFWVGGTHAGKSMMVKIHTEAFGRDYCKTGKNETITKTAKSFGNGPSPELAQFKNAHTAFYSEIGQDEILDAGKIKKRTGGDDDFGRMCKDNGGAITNTVKDITIVNKIPDFNFMDEAMIERLDGVTLFLSKFVFDPPETEEEQYKQRRFKRDNFFENKIPELGPAFLWVLVQKFESYKKETLVPIPNEIRRYIDDYLENLDQYSLFINCKVQNAYIRDPTDDDEGEIDLESKITPDEMFVYFKTWFMNNNHGSIVPKFTVFKEEMVKKNRLGKLHALGFWRGVKIIMKNVKKEE